MFISSSCCRRISSSCLTIRHVFLVTNHCGSVPQASIVALLCYRIVSRNSRLLQLSPHSTPPQEDLQEVTFVDRNQHHSKWCSSSTVPSYLATFSSLGSILDSISLCATTRLSFRLVPISVQIYRKYLLRFLSLSQRGSFGEEILHKQIRSIITKRQIYTVPIRLALRRLSTIRLDHFKILLLGRIRVHLIESSKNHPSAFHHRLAARPHCSRTSLASAFAFALPHTSHYSLHHPLPPYFYSIVVQTALPPLGTRAFALQSHSPHR